MVIKFNTMKQKAEEIYHRFVNYEWNDVGEGLKNSILEAIETALKEGQKLPIHNVSNCECKNLPEGEIAITSKALTNPNWKS